MHALSALTLVERGFCCCSFWKVCSSSRQNSLSGVDISRYFPSGLGVLVLLPMSLSTGVWRSVVTDPVSTTSLGLLSPLVSKLCQVVVEECRNMALLLSSSVEPALDPSAWETISGTVVWLSPSCLSKQRLRVDDEAMRHSEATIVQGKDCLNRFSHLLLRNEKICLTFAAANIW